MSDISAMQLKINIVSVRNVKQREIGRALLKLNFKNVCSKNLKLNTKCEK